MDPFVWPALALALSVSGQPLQAELLQSPQPACEQRDRAAASWRAAGRPVHIHRVGAWCIAASIHEGQWEAEQWTDRTAREPAGPASHGWRVRLPLQRFPSPSPQLARFGLDPQGSEMSIQPSQASSLQAAHREVRGAYGLVVGAAKRGEQAAEAEPPFLISRAGRGAERLTLISVRSDRGELVNVVLREQRP